MLIQKKSEEFQNSVARISSSTYRNTRSDCKIRFRYYISGDIGNYFIKPAIHPVGAEKDIMLDFLSATTSKIFFNENENVFSSKQNQF